MDMESPEMSKEREQGGSLGFKQNWKNRKGFPCKMEFELSWEKFVQIFKVKEKGKVIYHPVKL